MLSFAKRLTEDSIAWISHHSCWVVRSPPEPQRVFAAVLTHLATGCAATLFVDYEVPLISDEGEIDERWWACWRRTTGIAQGRKPEDYRVMGKVLTLRCEPGGIDREVHAINAMVAEANLEYERGDAG